MEKEEKKKPEKKTIPFDYEEKENENFQYTPTT